MALYLTLFSALIGFATFRALREQKLRQERRRRTLENLRAILDA